jgi:stage V sporulation protein B
MGDIETKEFTKGTNQLVIAQMVFLLSGYVIHLVLGRYFGPETYGTYGVVLSLMTTINLLLIVGFPQGASKYIAAGSAIGSIIRQSTKIQTIFAIVIFAAYLGLAGVVADALNDPSLAPYIRISAFVVPVYALYCMYNNGYLNGLRRFDKQAKTLIISSVVKMGAVFALVFLGLGVNGAIFGYLAAAIVGLFLAWRYLGTVARSAASFDLKKLLKFGIPATILSVSIFLLINIDLFMVKAILQDNVSTGYYTSAGMLAKIPYYIFTGLSLIVLPSISRSVAINDVAMLRSYIRQAMRHMLILLLPLVLVISATSSELISLVYSSAYIDAARPLSLLIVGLGLLSIFLMLTNIIMGSGKPKIAMLLGLLMVPLDVGLNLWLIPHHGLMGAAIATTATVACGALVALAYVLLKFRTLGSMKSFVRIGVTSGAIYGIVLQFSIDPVFLPLLYITLAAVYLGALFLTGEASRNDLEALKSILPTKLGK